MKKIILGITSVLLVAFAINTQAQTALRKKHFNIEDGIAIQGYDPVAYFTQNKAVKGSKDMAVVYNGVTYYFSSTSNKELFKTNPAKYEPEYGGWCAYAMGANGDKVEIDPQTFKIKDGKLYLFYHTYFNNTLNKWNKDESNLHTKANQNWAKTFQ